MPIKGNIEADQLTDALRSLAKAQKTGVLSLTNDNDKSKVFIQDGAVIYAMGSQKEARLGQLLESKGIITPQQLQDCLKESTMKKKSLGKILVEEGLISIEILHKIIRKQAESMIARLLQWQQGHFEFKETPLSLEGMVVNKLGMAALIVSASRLIKDDSFFQVRIADVNLVFEKSGPVSDDIALRPEEKDLLSRIDGRKTMEILITESGSEATTVRRALYTLMVVGLIKTTGKLDAPVGLDEPFCAAPDSKSPRENVAVAGNGGQPAEEEPETAASVELDLSEYSRGEDLKKKILKNAGDLPPMLEVALKAKKIMDNPSSSFKQISSILETDQAIAGRVLKMANSAYYGLSGKVSSIQHASVVLGFKTLGDIIAVVGASSFMGDKLVGYNLDSGDLWRHSLMVAMGSRIIAGKKRPRLADDAFSAGLFHDAGKMVLDKIIIKRDELFKKYMNGGRRNFLQAEKKILGLDHSLISSELCKNWNLPNMMTKAIKHHHAPSKSHQDDLAYILHLADAIAVMSRLESGLEAMEDQLEEGTLEYLGFEEADVANMATEIADSVQKISEEIHTTEAAETADS